MVHYLRTTARYSTARGVRSEEVRRALRALVDDPLGERDPREPAHVGGCLAEGRIALVEEARLEEIVDEDLRFGCRSRGLVSMVLHAPAQCEGELLCGEQRVGAAGPWPVPALNGHGDEVLQVLADVPRDRRWGVPHDPPGGFRTRGRGQRAEVRDRVARLEARNVVPSLAVCAEPELVRLWVVQPSEAAALLAAARFALLHRRSGSEG